MKECRQSSRLDSCFNSRDTVSLFSEKIDQDDEEDTDHFENIQSTNWFEILSFVSLNAFSHFSYTLN